MLVKFENVGRGKKSWESSIDCPNYTELLRAVKKGRALMSRDISFEFDEDDNKSGNVCVGITNRAVGRFTIIPEVSNGEN